MKRNHLLSYLSTADLDLLKPHLEPIELPRLFQVETPHKPIPYIYFPQDGIVSVVATIPRDHRIEVGIIGRDGLTGHSVVMGTDRSANSTFMQVPGYGLRIKADQFRAAILKSDSLREGLLAFVNAFAAQASQTALANGRATLDVRLARWLLMAHDRLPGDRIPLTHELLSIMLGVRRPGVSLALQKMEEDGLIETQRSIVIIRSRSGLKKIAKGFYGVPEAEQERLTGWRPMHDHE
ncbi:MAG TPA: Crp/Fnr family transcriptional regulator [Rhizomicrobium sp.]|nr:Crp/Fnr family transcriptional regulator [Rhizomicrobium sp.]